MKKHLVSFFIIVSLGTLSWAQGKKDLFDVRKSREELEIMKGILSTKLSFAAQDSQKESSSLLRFSNLNAFYLHGQGAVFIIPTSNLRSSNLAGLSGYFSNEYSQVMEAYSERLRQAAAAMVLKAPETPKASGNGIGSGIGSGTGGGVSTAPQDPPSPPPPPTPPTPPSPPSPPIPPTPPSPPTPFQASSEVVRNLEEMEAKAKKSREEAEANRKKFLQDLDEIKNYLIEALANYGDSLTTVKSSEHVNLVLIVDDFDSDAAMNFSRRRTRNDVISVQKSWVTDYKAGRLSLDNFKQKALQYIE